MTSPRFDLWYILAGLIWDGVTEYQNILRPELTDVA